MEKEKLKHEVVIYKPNNKLYVILTVLFGLIVTISFIVLCINIYKTDICTIMSAIISVFGGALASVIVAWLIDIFTCNRNNTSLILREKKCIEYVVILLDLLFQAFADTQSDLKSVKPAGWEVWFRKLVLQNFKKDQTDFYECMLGIYVSLNEVIAQIHEVNSGDLKDFIIQNEATVLSELIMLSDICRRLQNLIFNDNLENIDHIVYCMNDVLSTLLVFVKLSQKEYIPHSESIQAKKGSPIS